MRGMKWILALVIAIGLPGAGWLVYKPDDPLHRIDLTIGDRAYADAAKLLEAEIAKNPKEEDTLLLKWAAAYELNKEYNQAIATLDRLLEKFPQSEWTRKAQFRKAQCLAALKQWDKAETVAGEQVKYLVSNERKMELAETYLKYAQANFRPADLDKKPDYEKARVFFEKALELGITGPKAEEIRYRIGLCHFELRQFDQAITRLDTFAKNHPKSKWASPALFQLGLARANKGETVRARIHFRDLIGDYPDTTQAAQALYEIARKTYGTPNPQSDEALELGVKTLREFVAKYPDHACAPWADLEIGLSYKNRGRADQAIAELRRFIEKKTKSYEELLPGAKIDLGHVLRGQKKFDEAIAVWSEYLKAHPTHNQWDNVQREIITARFQIAEDLLRLKKYDEARKALEEYLVQYPLDSRTPQAAFLLGDIDFRLEQYDKAIAQWEKVVSKHAGQEYAKRARYRIAATYEQKLNNLPKAYEMFKKSAEEDQWGEGQQRFNELKQKRLSVVTERVLRTDEKPVLRVATRNIEKLKFAAYPINMETYFKRHHSFRGVENLDITLIEPVKRWDYAVPKYEKYRLYEIQAEVPLPGPGVWAINVTDEELEATTMFVVSDLALITKSTKKEVFAFAQNTRTKKPYPKAQILVSDGGKILYSGQTDEKGILQQKMAELKTAGEARFFAFDGAHYASNDLNIGQLAYVEEIQPKAYIFTDKPAYRPGQLVHAAGIVRKVRDGQYEFEKGEEFTCDLTSARGDLVERKKVALDEFGMFNADFVVAAQAPLGEYKIALYKEKGPSFTGTFRVERYQLENIELKIDLPQTVFLRGDKVKGKIIAKYYYGEPVKDHPLVYEIPGFFIREARTSNTGEVAFEFDTREFVESQMLTLQARLTEDNVAQAKNLWIATKALNLAVSTVRNVYLAGEKFDVTVKAADLAGEKTTATATVHVVKLEVVDGKETEKETATHEVKFGKEKGEGRVAVQVADGGNYVIRAEGKDRFGTPVTAQKRLFVSGEQDKVVLRILGDRETFKVGEQATVNLVCRTTDTVLGLITFESDGILNYEIKELKKGENPYEFRMADAYAPNIVLAVSGIHGNRFFTAEKDLLVNKSLTIEVKPDKETYEPGSKADVTMRAFDQEGKPVRAQIVLGLVDQALFALYGESLPDIREFFYGGRRGRSVRTDSSATFRYTPPTKQVAQAIREEEERLKAEREHRVLADATAASRPAAGPGGGSGLGTVRAPAKPAAPPVPGVATATFGFMPVDAPARAGEGEKRAEMQQARSSSSMKVAGEKEMDDASALGVRLAQDMEGFRTGIKAPEEVRGVAVGGGRFQLGQQSAGLALNREFEAMGASKLVSFDQNFDGLTDIANGRIAMESYAHAYVGYKDGGAWGIVGGDKAVAEATTARTLFLELAYWNPRVVTDEKGEAKVSITLPDNTTTWKLRARGTTAKTVVGDGSGLFVARRDFFVDLKLPRMVTEGNSIKMGVSVHNLGDKPREVELNVHSVVSGQLSVAGEKQAATDKKTDTKKLTVKAHGTETVSIERQIVAGEQLKIEAEARGEGVGDKVVRSVPIRPWGIEVRDSKGGKAHDSLNVTLRLPEGKSYTNRSMEISVGPVIEQTLFDLPPMGFGGANTTLASRVLADAALVEYLARTGERDTARYRTTVAELQQLTGQLASSRRDDGGWVFAGNTAGQAGGDPYVSALSLRALARAQALGVAISDDAMAKAIAGIENAYQKLAETENAKKADLLYALSFVNKADFTYANRLYRLRNNLDSRSLALVTLTLLRLERAPMAKEVAELLAAKDLFTGKMPVAREAAFPWSGDPLETNAFTVLALEKVGGFDKKVEEGVAWLLQHKSGHLAPVSSFRIQVSSYISPISAKGVAAMTEALAEYYGQAKPATNDYTVEVLVNEKPVKKISVTGSTRTLTIDVPADAIVEGANRVDLQYNGRGEFAYSCVLSGFTRDFKSVETRDGKRPLDYRSERTYEPAKMVYDGKVIAAGFSVARNAQFYRNAVTELPAGQYTQVGVNFYPNRYPPERRYFVLTEPIPEGCTVLPNSVSGNFLHYEIGDGEITFYCGEVEQNLNIRYDLYGYVQGAFQILPSQLRNAYDPSDLFLAAPYNLKVLAATEKSSDKYELTPDEYYNLGLRVFERKDYDRTNELLETLTTKWELHPDPYQKAVEALLEANIARNDANRIVKYFEIIYEKYPKKVLTFDQILRVAKAYEQLREFERSYQVYRGMAESSFLTEANMSGELRKQGEFLAAIEFLHKLIHTYPDLEIVQQSLYSLSQLVYATSNKMQEVPELKEKKVTREDLLWRTITLLDEYIANYPENPTVGEAAFSMANAYLDLEASNDVVALCQRFQKRYPKSSFLSGYQYVEAYGHFINGRYDEALALCKKVATEKYPTATGAMDYSDNRDLAIYIMGQIYHAQTKPVEAIAEYDRVKDKFADAKEAIEYFKEKRLELAEVAQFKTAEKPAVAVTYRNIKQLDLRAFRVDLMKLYLTRRNLNNIADVDLAGIEPYATKAVALGEGMDYMDKKTSVALELKDKGAFLVMAKGDELNRSTMILRSDLGLDVQEDPGSGRVRANVYRRASKLYLAKADVKVIGEGNPDFTSGETDLRGIFVADNIRGRVTIIARFGDEYVFYRGQTPLQGFVPPPPPVAAAPPVPQPGTQVQQRADLRQTLNAWNDANQFRNADFATQQIMQNPVKGGDVWRVRF